MEIYKVGDLKVVFCKDDEGNDCVKCFGEEIDHTSWQTYEMEVIKYLCKAYENLKIKEVK